MSSSSELQRRLKERRSSRASSVCGDERGRPEGGVKVDSSSGSPPVPSHLTIEIPESVPGAMGTPALGAAGNQPRRGGPKSVQSRKSLREFMDERAARVASYKGKAPSIASGVSGTTTRSVVEELIEQSQRDREETRALRQQLAELTSLLKESNLLQSKE